MNHHYGVASNHRWLQLLHGILPNACLWCQLPVTQPSAQLCEDCISALPRLSLVGLRHALQRPEIWRGLHPVNFDRLYSLNWYQLPWSYWIKQWKFQQDDACGQVLRREIKHAAAEFRQRVQTELLQPGKGLPDAICFVPLSPARYRQRGFNQAEQLAKILAMEWQVPLLHLFERSDSKQHQSELNRRQRQRNLRRQIRLRCQQRLPAHLVLVDDVITTGATLNEICRLLRRQHVQYIDVWTLAITASDRRSHKLG